jgi:hypothetical protein
MIFLQMIQTASSVLAIVVYIHEKEVRVERKYSGPFVYCTKRHFKTVGTPALCYSRLKLGRDYQYNHVETKINKSLVFLVSTAGHYTY